MKISYLIITHQRAAELKEAVESILQQDWPDFEIVIVDNASTDETQQVVEQIARSAPAKIVYHRPEVNLGTSIGRNKSISLSTGEILISIDDDAVLTTPDAARRVVNFFEKNPDVGILAFKIIDHATSQVLRYYFPTRNKKRNPDEDFETSWFIGAGHAVRREVYDAVGGYRDYSPYGCEEQDLSWKALDQGFRIWYFPQAAVLHKPSPKGRTSDQTKLRAGVLKNRIKVSYMNLPAPYFITHFLIWSFAYLVRFSRFDIRCVLLGWRLVRSEAASWGRERCPIKSSTVKKIKALNGQIWY